MKVDGDLISRRTLLRCAAAVCVMAQCAPRAAAAAENELAGPENDPTLIVAGPPDSSTASWGRLLLPSLAGGMARGVPLSIRYVGGEDGVTAANQFDGRAVADGSQALLFPGCVALSWMAGDSRAQFDLSHFQPLLALTCTNVLMIRGGLAPPKHRRPVRLLCGTGPRPALTALMALDLIGIAAVPVHASVDAPLAVRNEVADAVFVHGSDVPGQVRTLMDAGLSPAFCTALPLPRAEPPSGHVLHGVPHLLSLLAPARRDGDPLVTAWRGVATASALDVVLALPRMSTAASVTTWRRACRASLGSDAIGQQIESRSLQPLSDRDTASAMQLLWTDASAQSTFRRWLAERLNWRPA
jgi:hypothetical protein